MTPERAVEIRDRAGRLRAEFPDTPGVGLAVKLSLAYVRMARWVTEAGRRSLK